MSDDREYVQPASSTYEDWKGTAVAENDIVKGKDLYELAGLDHSNWSILGMDFIGGGAPGSVYVYALDRVKHKVHSHDDLMKLAEREGSLPVVSILLHDVSSAEVVAECFKSFCVNLRSRGIRDHAMEVVGRDDYPKQR